MGITSRSEGEGERMHLVDHALVDEATFGKF